MEQFLKRIIDNLKTKRVDYGDVRFVEQEVEIIVLKNGVIEAISHISDSGFGVRVLKDSAWGFSSSNIIKKSEADRVTNDALKIARASATVKSKTFFLSPLKPQKGTYTTMLKENPMDVALDKKLDLLMACDRIMAEDKRIKVRTGFMRFKRVKTHFASTEGALIKQKMVFSGGSLKVFAMEDGEMQSRSYGNYNQAGYEFIQKLKFLENAARIREEVLMLLKAKPCPDVKTTLILDAEQMVLQTHESCGHPTELDRVLGTEASYAGTSFLTTDKLNKFKYGSEVVNIVADATTPGGLGTFGWDDEGVPGQKVYLVKNGIFVGYLSSRETAPIVNSRSSGAMRADGWNRIPLIRMTNINLVPGTWSFEDMIADTDSGIFMTTNKSWSIDDKRLNFQFGCELARKIENGKLTEVYKNPLYADITPRFWNSCDAFGDKKSWQLFGVPNCGKGEPGQTAFVGHGTVPARFRDVQVGIKK
ncbi:MAG TPA: TldD/PmbA family protein [candidate division WOR-3 bacterium]|uniref:TldD/PmbA family protein n=1 Tax=candidate division WOR-3 bacterium TaxID=2052148 RepID=A0A9C9EMN5_UNCW3|nr:TldD/PmbA family protein [candidate division WOR-3 bacterium]